MSGPQHGSDKSAAFTGLIGGVLFVGAILYGITMWTNAKFAGHEEGGKERSLRNR